MDRIGPFPLIDPQWSPHSHRGNGATPFYGIGYVTDLPQLLASLYEHSRHGGWEIIGTPFRGPVAIKHRQAGSEVHSAWAATLVAPPKSAESTAERAAADTIASLLRHHFPDAASVPSVAVQFATRAPFLPIDTAEPMRQTIHGGIQWSAGVYRGGKTIDAIHWDLKEAYTSALLRRSVPRSWTWELSPPVPTVGIEDQDSLYLAEIEVPDHVPWGFPTAGHWPGEQFVGFVSGEEIASAKIPRTNLRCVARWRPLAWTAHPHHKTILDLPRELRKRIANTLYGLHAKPPVRTRGHLVEPSVRRRGSRIIRRDLLPSFPMYWLESPMQRMVGRPDWASLTTARVRAAMHRALLTQHEPWSAYVDGILCSGNIPPDPWWPHVFEWVKKAQGEVTLYAPGIFTFTNGPPSAHQEPLRWARIGMQTREALAKSWSIPLPASFFGH